MHAYIHFHFVIHYCKSISSSAAAPRITFTLARPAPKDVELAPCCCDSVLTSAYWDVAGHGC